MALSDLSSIPNPDDKVVTILIAVLKDPEPQMRAGSAMAITVIGPAAKAAIPALVDLLGDETLDEAAGKVQAGAQGRPPCSDANGVRSCARRGGGAER